MTENDEHLLKVQQLFVRHQTQLKAFVVALSPGFAQADDVLQEVFLTVTAKAHEFDWRSACKSDPLRERNRRVNRTHRIGP